METATSMEPRELLSSPSPAVTEIHIPTLSLERFTEIVGERRARPMRDAAARAREVLGDRTVWNVNSTAAGGGVAEMLQTLLGYARGAGIDARWAVIEGDFEFFTITKRIHNGLHGSVGDGGPLGPAEHDKYTLITEQNAMVLCRRIRPNDVVILHDPQTAGLVKFMRAAGAIVIWRCHVGHDATHPTIARTWEFLRPYLSDANAYVFTRPAYVPSCLEGSPVYFIPPSIDAFSTKNQAMSTGTVHAILRKIGFLDGNSRNGATPVFTRNDGSTARVERPANIIHAGPLPKPTDPLVVQISRWDTLKDMLGVMRGFSQSAIGPKDAYLALVGPDVRAVTDDPEGAAVFGKCLEAWRALPEPVRNRILLVLLPMDDIEENAAMVNAIQRFATIIVQKSLHEGFGLTVTEAMWKGRPLIVSGVGGIKDQVTDEKHALVLSDPSDLTAFGSALDRLLEDGNLAQRLGRNAKSRCLTHFLGPRHLMQYVDLLAKVAA